MKKQNYIYKLFSVFLMLFAVLFTACSGLFSNDIELADTATISISLDDSQNRTVKPVYDFSSFTDFQLSGTKSGGTEETLKTWSTYSALVSGSVTIETGSWSFTLQAKKGNETFRGSTTATISQGSSVQLGFVMEHIQYGNTGTLSVSLRYPVSKPDPENYFAEITRVEYEVREIGVAHTLITSGTLTGDALANHEINLSRINMNVGKYGFMCEFYKGNQDSDFVSSYYEIIEIESGLETVIDDDITYFMERGFASTAAETVNGKGQMKFVVNCPSGTTGVELVRYYGNDKETITGKWIGSESRNRVITFYDKYELVKDTEYSYFVRYNYKWSENYEYPVTLKATANGLTAPVVNSYPRFTFDGRTITSITPPNVTFYNNEVQNCDSVKLILEYRDADDTDNWDDFGKHIELLYDFQNNTYNFNEDYTLSLSGETRTLYGAKIIVEKDGLSREFRLRDWNTNNKAKNDGVPEDLIFAEITKNDYIHFPITIPSGTRTVRIERCVAPVVSDSYWEHVGGKYFDSLSESSQTETFYDYYIVAGRTYCYRVKFYDNLDNETYYSFNTETIQVTNSYTANISGYTRPAFSENPTITYSLNNDGTCTISLTSDPVIDWKNMDNASAFWTIDFQYGDCWSWFNKNSDGKQKKLDLSFGANDLHQFYFYYSTDNDFFNSYRYFTDQEIVAMGIPLTITKPIIISESSVQGGSSYISIPFNIPTDMDYMFIERKEDGFYWLRIGCARQSDVQGLDSTYEFHDKYNYIAGRRYDYRIRKFKDGVETVTDLGYITPAYNGIEINSCNFTTAPAFQFDYPSKVLTLNNFNNIQMDVLSLSNYYYKLILSYSYELNGVTKYCEANWITGDTQAGKTLTSDDGMESFSNTEYIIDVFFDRDAARNINGIAYEFIFSIHDLPNNIRTLRAPSGHFFASNAGVNGVKLTLKNLPDTLSSIRITDNGYEERFMLDGDDINDDVIEIYDFFVTPGVIYNYSLAVYDSSNTSIYEDDASIIPTNGFGDYVLHRDNLSTDADYVQLSPDQLPFTKPFTFDNFHTGRGVMSEDEIRYNHYIYPNNETTVVKDYYLSSNTIYYYKPYFDVVISGMGKYRPRIGVTEVNYSGTSQSLRIVNASNVKRGTDGNLTVPFEVEWYSQSGEGDYRRIGLTYLESDDFSSGIETDLDYDFEENSFPTEFDYRLFSPKEWILGEYYVTDRINDYVFYSHFRGDDIDEFDDSLKTITIQ